MVSIIIPIKDEADNIEPLAHELTAVMDRQTWDWECLWIDDGSADGSLYILERLVLQDPRHRYISFEKNAGQAAAFWAGFQEAKGTILATIDGDGQNDPADIPDVVTIVQSGESDMVNGYRSRRQDNLVRKLAARVANGFRNLVTGRTVKDVGCSTRAFTRECVKYLPLFKGMHRFLPTLVSMRGFQILEVPVNHRPRLRGKTKYTINNRLWVGLVDTFGVFWLKKRGFQYKIEKRSDPFRGALV